MPPPPFPPPSPPHTPAAAQAVDRAHRMGQKREVTVYRLLSAGTLDEQVARLAAGKLELDSALKGKGLLGGGLPASSKKEKPRPAEEKKAVLEALVRTLM